MAAESAAVLGVVIDTATCCVVATGLDGTIREEHTRRFPTPNSYGQLLDHVVRETHALHFGSSAKLLGSGVSVPGLVNDRLGEIVVSSNLPMLNQQNPARDLENKIGVPCLLLQETDGLCLAEQLFGDARGLADFAMLDASAGLGLSVVSGGELLAGHSGMAGEVGHITVAPDGVRCGCGNRGCLETLATDTALVRLVSEEIGRPLDIEQTAALLAERPEDFASQIATVTEYLAIAIATVVNVFNPTAIFVHGTLLAGSEERFSLVLERVRHRALTASLADCTISATKSSKRKGAVAGIVHHLTQTWAPLIR
jgi:N-acetylglucosamine repressor